MLHVPDYAPIGAGVLAGALVVGAFAQSRTRWLLWVALCAVIAAILWLTLGLAFGDAGGTGLNLTPFDEIRRALHNGGSGHLNLVGNVAMFVPVGALVAWIAQRWRVAVATVVGFLFSVGIELTQLGLGRVADVDDVILNTAGAILGALLAVAWRAAFARRIVEA